MHDSMQYGPILGQGQGHELFKVGNPAIFKTYPSTSYNGSLPQILKLGHDI